MARSIQGKATAVSGAQDLQDACYALNLVARLLSTLIARELAAVRVTPGQLPVMLALADSNAMTQAELARATQVEQSTMAVALARMEREGLVIKTRDLTHGRRVLVSLTAKGREILPAIQDARARIDQQSLQGIGAADRKQLGALLEQMARNLSS